MSLHGESPYKTSSARSLNENGASRNITAHSAAEEPPGAAPTAPNLLQDWLYRQSTLVENVVNKRWGVLYTDYLVTFRNAKDSKPSKRLSLNGCTVSREVMAKPYKIRKQHRNTVWALATGSVIEKQLYCFTLTSSKQSPLTICFEEQEKAVRWHSLLVQLVTAAKAHHAVINRNSGSARRWDKPGAEGGSVHSRNMSLTDDVLVNTPHLSDDGLSPFSVEVTPRKVAPYAQHSSVAGDDDEVCSYADAGDHLEGDSTPMNYWDEGPAECQLATFQRRWRSRMHVNGVAVYVENATEEEGDTKMVSVPVRCTPEACFRALMRHGFSNWQVLEQRDAHNTVLYQQRAFGSWFAAYRDCVMLRTWRRDQDGSFIILLQDVEHDAAAPLAPASILGGGTVRAHVRAAGVIIAPCAQEYITGSGHSTECLVTVMAKIDLGGWLSPSCWLGKWLAASPLDTSTTSSWVGPLVNKIITLRDLVEQGRFIRKPFDDALASHTGLAQAHSMPITDAHSLTEEQRIRSIVGRTHSFAPAAAVANHRGSVVSLAGRPPVNPMPSGSGKDDRMPGLAGSPEEPLAADDQMRWAAGTLPLNRWSGLSSAGFKVRGPTYLKDRKKIPAAEPIFGLASVDVVRLKKPTYHIARHLPSIRLSTAPFTFVVNIMVPSKPFLALVIAWAATDFSPELNLDVSATGNSPSGNAIISQPSGQLISGTGSVLDDEVDSDQEGPCAGMAPAPFDLCMARFMAGSDEQRDSKFKLIPRIAEGSWVIKQSVGTTPVILGKKLKTTYHRGANYMEVDIDIGSSSVAASVVNLVYGATKSLVIDMAVLIEGQAEDELPEQLLGAVRLDHMDLAAAPWLDTERNVVTETPLL